MRALIVSILAFTAACGSLPRDPERTFDRVSNGALRIGLIGNPPWVIRGGGEATC